MCGICSRSVCFCSRSGKQGGPCAGTLMLTENLGVVRTHWTPVVIIIIGYFEGGTQGLVGAGKVAREVKASAFCCAVPIKTTLNIFWIGWSERSWLVEILEAAHMLRYTGGRWLHSYDVMRSCAICHLVTSLDMYISLIAYLFPLL